MFNIITTYEQDQLLGEIQVADIQSESDALSSEKLLNI